MNQLILYFFIVLLIFSTFMGLGQESNLLVREQLKRHNLNTSLNAWKLTSEHKSSTSNTRHIYYQQTIDGIVLRGTESSVHYAPSGKLLMEHNRFVKNISAIKSRTTSTVISPQEALQVVVNELGYPSKEEYLRIENAEHGPDLVLFDENGISPRNIPAKLVYGLDREGNYRLLWEVSILELDYSRFLVTDVDAESGEIINTRDIIQRCSFSNGPVGESPLNYNANLYDRVNIGTKEDTNTICEVCYEVFESPKENPFAGNRAIIQNPADPIASPYGWHDTDGLPGSESLKTEGNNTMVLERGDNRGYQTYGGERLDFTGFTFNSMYTIENQSEDAALSNVFYWNNMVHDITYHFGFDEFSGNFQKVNYVASGRSNDALETRVQTRIGCQAYYVDGVGGTDRPITVLGICDDKDAAFDNIIIVHEYAHGIVSQLLGGAESGGCLGNDEQMTEGWADWFGLMLTLNASDTGADRRPIGNFFFGQGEHGGGIRNYPYSTDFEENPETYDAIKTASVPHGVGAVWATMLWEMTWDLIDAYGFDENLANFTGDVHQDAGNIMAMAIVVEGLKLMLCAPGFVDGREAILTANRSIYGKDNDCLIFNAFARRGLGVHANQGLTTSSEDGTEDFTQYPEYAEIAELPDICQTGGIRTGITGGLPFGGVYSGVGIMDDGNGISFSIDTSVTGVGKVEVTYSMEETQCVFASSATEIISVFWDEMPPEMTCPENMVAEVSVGEGYTLPDFTFSTSVTDNCFGEIILSQSPEPHTMLKAGRHFITMTALDTAGNTTSCEFTFEILEVGNVSFDFINVVSLFPVPAKDEVTVYNPSGGNIQRIALYEVSGKLIREIKIDSRKVYIPVGVDDIASGNYFFIIQSTGDTVVRRMLKL